MTEKKDEFRSGYVNIIGNPNVGKSTLLNKIINYTLSPVNPKAQTTRHRILGIHNEENYQIIFSDTPGLIEPKYELHKRMINEATSAFEDSDILVVVIDINNYELPVQIDQIRDIDQCNLIFVLNKIDLSHERDIKHKITDLESEFPSATIVPISAKENFNIDSLMNILKVKLPVHPPYFPRDLLSDRSERFFVEEIIREKILKNYKQEIPYSSQVIVTEFKEEDRRIKIRADIYLERDTQKYILIGREGSALKKLGTESRLELEKFFKKNIFLDLYIKVSKDWRKDPKKLDKFGY